MKTIFFDWGGVVADDPGDNFLTKLLLDLGANDEQIQDIFHLYMKRFMKGEITEAEYWDELRINYGFIIKDSISDEFKKWSGLIANDDIFALVDEAKSKGWQTAILSNVIEPTYNALKSAGLYERFDIVIASCKEGVAKPDTKIYRLALERANTTPGQSIFIDDKQNNLKPAKEMGFQTVLASNPAQIIKDVRAML